MTPVCPTFVWRCVQKYGMCRSPGKGGTRLLSVVRKLYLMDPVSSIIHLLSWLCVLFTDFWDKTGCKIRTEFPQVGQYNNGSPAWNLCVFVNKYDCKLKIGPKSARKYIKKFSRRVFVHLLYFLHNFFQAVADGKRF